MRDSTSDCIASNGTPEAPRFIELGHVCGVFGTRGWLKVHSYTRPRANLLDYPFWWVGKSGETSRYQLEATQIHGHSYLALLEGFTTRESALSLLQAPILIPASELPCLAAHEFYWAELVGMEVITRDDHNLGAVTSLVEAGDHDVLVIRGQREYLIPFVQGHFVMEVARESRRIVVDWHPDD